MLNRFTRRPAMSKPEPPGNEQLTQRNRANQKNDITSVAVIKDGTGRILTDEENIKKRWEEYFRELLNTENEKKPLDEIDAVEGPVQNISTEEIVAVIKDTKNSKAPGPSEIPTEHLKNLDEEVFLDLEKAFDRVPREVMYWCLWKRVTPEKLVRLVEATYRNAATKVVTQQGATDEFEITVGVHQGSALSPFLFINIMDTLQEDVRTDMPWELLFTDDVALIPNTEEELQQKIKFGRVNHKMED
ncbi:uncharacterized protein LOC125047888 [Penaeus chinensis]|uniref:uncharacterized protein LOC125047888 n=1 Tax=Penaeus chinensis TaxID=139456 RepID=UPI001FB6A1B4|nr:uncharacterized protein LOC125047888 [Penaeus chinensis]